MDDLITRVKSICDELAREDGTGGQVALAAAAGASKSVVNQWLAGKIKSIDINYALEIERSLGYNHIWLMIGKGPRKHSERSQAEWDEIRATRNDIAHGVSAANIPKTENPVSADVLAALGFLQGDEAHFLNWYRMSTDGAKVALKAMMQGANKKQLSALVDDQAQGGLARTGDSNSQ